jgi:hypothetical protein
MAILTAAHKVPAVVSVVGQVKDGEFGSYRPVLFERGDRPQGSDRLPPRHGPNRPVRCPSHPRRRPKLGRQGPQQRTNSWRHWSDDPPQTPIDPSPPPYSPA